MGTPQNAAAEPGRAQSAAVGELGRVCTSRRTREEDQDSLRFLPLTSVLPQPATRPPRGPQSGSGEDSRRDPQNKESSEGRERLQSQESRAKKVARSPFCSLPRRHATCQASGRSSPPWGQLSVRVFLTHLVSVPLKHHSGDHRD